MNERVTVEVDAETLKRAREAGVDLSATLRRALRRELPPPTQQAAEEWYRDNKAAVDSCNAFIERHGLLSSRLRYRAGRE
jgi:antitoxin CcdA